MSEERIIYCGYILEIEESRSDGRYHDRRTVVIRVRDAETDKVIHTAKQSSRSTHQLSKRYRPADDVRDSVTIKATQWIIDNCPDARIRLAEEHERSRREASNESKRRYEELEGDALAYVLELDDLLSATDLARILGLASARVVNKRLLEWGLQTKDGTGYWPIRNEHGRVVGTYAQLLWTTRGLKAAWDAGCEHNVFSGGDAAFLAQVRHATQWLSFLDQK